MVNEGDREGTKAKKIGGVTGWNEILLLDVGVSLSSVMKVSLLLT